MPPLRPLARIALACAFLALAKWPSANPVAPTLSIFPKPDFAAVSPGECRIDGVAQIFAGPGLENEESELRSALRRGGIRESGHGQTISLTLDPSWQGAAEGYSLDIEPTGIEIRAGDPAGVFYGIETLRQLAPADAGVGVWRLPCAKIEDQPRFRWRGMLLDVSRHFFDKAEVEHFLDLLALHKMNTFHWHLVDDGGWRLEIKRYPLLTKKGAYRRATKELWSKKDLKFVGEDAMEPVYGGYYTQDDVREIVRYAARKHIQVVPEIEMPGHSLAAIQSYPELACDADPQPYAEKSGYPGANVLCAGQAKTYEFLRNVLNEVCDLFPGKVIHVGGDEVDPYLWDHCARCQALAHRRGLKGAAGIESYLMRGVSKMLAARGRTLLGWDEIAAGGLAPGSMVMSWHGVVGGIAAAKNGHDVVMTPVGRCYFDYPYEGGPQDQPLSAERVLGFKPLPDELNGKPGANHVIGGQCNLWTERVPDVPTAEERLFPRMLSMSERLWSNNADPAPLFAARLQGYYRRLAALGVRFHVAPPEIKEDGPKIALEGPPIVGSVVRFTTDGREPGPGSPVYSHPIEPRPGQTVKAAAFAPGGSRSRTVEARARN